MNVFKEFRKEIEKITERMSARGELPPDLPLDRISVEPPRDPAHGDISSNVAMVLAGKRKPRDLAEDIAAILRENRDVDAVEVAGPGFINLRVGTGFWQARVADVLEAGRSYGDTDIGGGQAVNVEYVSANPTGPMHIGHARGAVIGDVLATLLAKAGYEVTREYYVNDAGAQIEALARSALLRYREALGENVGEVPAGLYPGEYLVPVGEALADRDGDKWVGAPEDEALAAAGDFAVAAMMDAIREDLAALGIEHDVFRSERDLHRDDSVSAVVEELQRRDLVYFGRLDPPKGRKPDDWEEREQLLFRSTRFGDDVDRPLRKSGGDWTYFAADTAYHLDKFRRGFNQMVDVWGADHKGYVGRMQAAVAAVAGGEATLDVRICNLVNLYEKGRPVKMSKRSGTFVTLREVVDEVGRDVVRFMMLTRSNDAPLDFDLKRALDQSRDNPVFYVQYAHARACSVLRNVRDVFPLLPVEDSALAATDMSAVDDDAELALIRSLAGWPRLVEASAAAREPHRIAYYLHQVAAAFHGLWNKGNETEGLRFIVPADEKLTRARLALVRATALVIASGLQIMGVEPVEEMR